MGKIKAVIFDLNGIFVLGDYLSKRVEKKYRIPGDEFFKALKSVMSRARLPGVGDSFSLWRPHLKKLGLNMSRDEFFGFWTSGEKINREMINYARELRAKGIRVYLLSNNFKERTVYYRRSYPELFASVDGAFFSWETGFVKPDRRAFGNLLTQCGLKAGECLYFDDSERNVEAARKLGIASYLYRNLAEVRSTVDRYLHAEAG